MEKKNYFKEFCRRNYYWALVSLTIGGGFSVISDYLSISWGYWISLFSLFIIVPSAVVLLVGLATAIRQQNKDKGAEKEKGQSRI
jgi:large-conductance mechanosensitive channel